MLEFILGFITGILISWFVIEWKEAGEVLSKLK